jgi:hypothetical protein
MQPQSYRTSLYSGISAVLSRPVITHQQTIQYSATTQPKLVHWHFHWHFFDHHGEDWCSIPIANVELILRGSGWPPIPNRLVMWRLDRCLIGFNQEGYLLTPPTHKIQQRDAKLPRYFAVCMTENTIFGFSGVNRIALLTRLESVLASASENHAWRNNDS